MLAVEVLAQRKETVCPRLAFTKLVMSTVTRIGGLTSWLPDPVVPPGMSISVAVRSVKGPFQSAEPLYPVL